MQEKRITVEQWIRIENALKKLEEYEKRVQEYLLFLMGGMRELSGCEQIKSYDEAPEKIKKLEEELYSIDVDIIFWEFIFRDGEFKDVELDEAAEHRRGEMHWKNTVLNSNVRSWLNAASIFIQSFNDAPISIDLNDLDLVEIEEEVLQSDQEKDMEDVAFSQSVTLHVMKKFLDSSRVRFRYDEEKARQTEKDQRNYLDEYDNWIREGWGWDFLETDEDRISSIDKLNRAVEEQAVNRALVKFTDRILNDFFC